MNKLFILVALMTSFSVYADCTVKTYGNVEEEIGVCAKAKFIELSLNDKARFESNLSWESFSIDNLSCIRAHKNMELGLDLAEVPADHFICQTTK